MIPECVCSHGVSLKTLLSSLHSPSINIINMLQLTDMVVPPQWRAWQSLSYFFSLKNNKRISSFRNVNISASSLCVFFFILVKYYEKHVPQPPPKSHISHSPLGQPSAPRQGGATAARGRPITREEVRGEDQCAEKKRWWCCRPPWGKLLKV